MLLYLEMEITYSKNYHFKKELMAVKTSVATQCWTLHKFTINQFKIFYYVSFSMT